MILQFDSMVLYDIYIYNTYIKVGLDLRGLLQPERCYDSMI